MSQDCAFLLALLTSRFLLASFSLFSLPCACSGRWDEFYCMKDGHQCFKVRTALDTWCTEDGKAKLEKQVAAEEPTGEGETENIWSNPKQLGLLDATTAERKLHKDVVRREDNKDALNEKSRTYRQKNKEDLSEWARTYRQENKEVISEWARTYRQENKEVISEKARSRRAAEEAARAERDLKLLAERGEEVEYDEFLNDVESKALECMVQLVLGLLQEGRGINILCAGENRTPPLRSNQQDADGSSFGRIAISGVPPDSVDETRRWAVEDSRPSVKDGRTHSNLSGPRFDELFEKYLVISHRYHEFVRMFEGQLQRLVCGDRYKEYWPLFLNSKTGDLDGTRYPGTCFVLIAATKKPLQQLYAEGELIRVKPGWSGLVGGTPLPTLVEKLREGSESMASGAIARPQLKMLRERTTSVDGLPGTVTLLGESRLICDADLGHINRNREIGTESHAFYNVRRWDDGTVGGHFGKLGNEAHGGQHVIIGLNLSEAAAMRLLETEVSKKIRQGYHYRASMLEEAETEAETEAEQAKASFCGVCDEEIVGRDLDHCVCCTAPPPAKRSKRPR